jgi:hypothetical protein
MDVRKSLTVLIYIRSPVRDDGNVLHPKYGDPKNPEAYLGNTS